MTCYTRAGAITMSEQLPYCACGTTLSQVKFLDRPSPASWFRIANHKWFLKYFHMGADICEESSSEFSDRISSDDFIISLQLMSSETTTFAGKA